MIYLTPSPILDGTLMSDVGFSHIALHVSDLSVSEAFYTRALEPIGFVPADGEVGRYRRLTNGKNFVIVLAQVEPNFLDRTHHRKGIGLHHLALRVPTPSDLTRMSEHLDRIGVPLIGKGLHKTDYRLGYSSLMFEDPDRIAIEIAWHDDAYFTID